MLYEKYRAYGFAMVAIQVHPDQNDLVPAWRTEGKYTFPVLFVPPARPGAPATQSYARTRFGMVGTPTDLLVNADRKIIFRHLGGTRTVMEAEIRELLGLKPFEGFH
jgi:hypothetical protein